MYLVWAVIISLLLMFVVIYYPPLQPIFHTMPIQAKRLAVDCWIIIYSNFFTSRITFIKKKEKKSSVIIKGIKLE